MRVEERPVSDRTDLLRVIIIDDDDSIRQVTRLVLQRTGRIRLVGQSDGSSQQDVDEACRTRPHVVLLDQDLGRLQGTDLIGPILRACPDAMIAMLTGIDAEEGEASALRAGAFVYYEKSAIPTGLVDHIEQDYTTFARALAGEDVVAPSALTRRRLRPR